MSRTDISAASLADYLRREAGDGGIEWCYEPMQTSVLLDIADMLDENAKLREQVRDMAICMDNSKPHCKRCKFKELSCQWFKFDERMRELGVEVNDAVDDA